MDQHPFKVHIPIQVDDIIEADGFINKFKVEDIIVIHYTRNPEVKIVLKLLDLEINDSRYYNYTDYKWKILQETN